MSFSVVAVIVGLWSGRSLAQAPVSSRLPDGVWPVIAVWGWCEDEFAPGGYRQVIDLMADHATYNLVATTLRLPVKELTDADVHAQIKEAARYARTRGMGLLMDLDVRLARAAFRAAYPDELQEMLRLREFSLADSGEVVARIVSETPSDHYTYRATPYIPLTGRLVRVYSYLRGPQGIEPDTVRDITADCGRATTASAKEVAINIRCGQDTKGRTACVMVAFTHLAADAYAPHLLEFQRDILRQYGDADLAGACKDEWGFPPCYDGCPAKNDYWYSRSRDAAYAQLSGGRDLIRDCLLMTFGERGRERERQAAINRFMAMATRRHGEIEDDFYRTTKAVFGPSAVIATHATWYPWPGTQEFKKNGLDWWVATRDLAQTDEVTPYCVRTALAKKWGSAVWYNMYYASHVRDYERQVWAYALAGGRMDFHPVWPWTDVQPRMARYDALLRSGMVRGDARIRLLNFISRSPLDCPVAVVFGHACAMNWAGPAYDDVGIKLTDRLWAAGYPADLIPTSEIASKALQIGEDGGVEYGRHGPASQPVAGVLSGQRYAAVVLYHPQFEGTQTAEFFAKVNPARTALYRLGDWETDFEGRPFAGNTALPEAMAALPDVETGAGRIVASLRERGVVAQTPATDMTEGFGYRSVAPPAKGQCRLTDGTQIIVSGAQNASGDPIQGTFRVNGHQVTVDAIGVVGVRLAADGTVAALAAGGLRRFQAGSFTIELPDRLDIALWSAGPAGMQGVVQDATGPLPSALLAITPAWSRIAIPQPLPAPSSGPQVP